MLNEWSEWRFSSSNLFSYKSLFSGFELINAKNHIFAWKLGIFHEDVMLLRWQKDSISSLHYYCYTSIEIRRKCVWRFLIHFRSRRFFTSRNSYRMAISNLICRHASNVITYDTPSLIIPNNPTLLQYAPDSNRIALILYPLYIVNI